MTAVRLTRLSHKTRNGMVLDKISLEIDVGRVHGLVGLPGSGRSALLRIIAGIDRPTSGHANVLGGNPLGAEIRSRVGYALSPNLLDSRSTVYETLHELACLKGLARKSISAMLDRRLRETKLDSFASETISDLSPSLRDRLFICAAWIGDPDVVLLDGRDGRLEPAERLVLGSLLQAQTSEGKTAVIAGWSFSLLGDVCDSVTLLHGGGPVATATPNEIRNGLQGLLFKVFVRGRDRLPLSLPDADIQRVEGGQIVLAGHELTQELARQYGENLVSEVDPTFDEACTWILAHPERIAARKELWRQDAG